VVPQEIGSNSGLFFLPMLF